MEIHRLAVSRVERLTDDAVALTFDIPDVLRTQYEFVQGQHVALSLPGETDVRRSYSICAPAGSGRLRVAVKLIPDGAFSTHAHTRLAVGDTLEVMTPIGRFNTPLDPAQERTYAAIAAGSGITPILSLAATTLEVEPKSSFTLLYANRTIASTMFLEELLDLKNRYTSRFEIYPVLSREPQEAPLLSGRLDAPKLERFLETVLSGRQFDEWFLCGPLEMVETLRAGLVERGVDARHIHRELFHAGPAANTAPQRTGKGATSTVTVILDGRASSFELARNGATILDAALTVRPDAPYACKGGVCGTCRARVLEGEIEMLGGYALESDELDAGFVLACQSQPRSERVTIDFDC